MFRAMPNTPVILQNGVTIHASGSHVTADDKQLLLDMVSSVGIGMEMQEHYMDIMTALSGGGPSFVSGHLSEFFRVERGGNPDPENCAVRRGGASVSWLSYVLE